ncbi:hypothetical protein ACF8FF_07385 [Pseudomonas sp. zjy_13]|uniref:hypothetical protein n=1 Tax=Pseudomonas sp. zjy_13 TaxID=3367263 RepID=UPI00370C70AA
MSTRRIDSPESPAMVMPKDQFIQEVLADVAKTSPEQARVMAQMAVEREQSRELRNILRHPFAVLFGTALLLSIVAAAALYVLGEQSEGALYVRVVACAVLSLVGGWAIFKPRRD